MTATINQCLTELQSLLETALVSATADKVYGFRILPDKLAQTVSLTYLGGAPQGAATGGSGRFYDFAAVLVVQHNNTEASLAAAEQNANAIENLITDTLEPSRNTYWNKVTFPRLSIRPPTPEEVGNARYGEIYFRLKLV